MTDLAQDDAAEELNPDEGAPEVQAPASEEPEASGEAETPSPEEPEQLADGPSEAAEAVGESTLRASQDALFGADLASAVEPAETDESGVTSFGGTPDELEEIRAELGQEPAEGATEADASAESEAAQAIMEAGVPEGQDDDPDAVAALLDAEAAEGPLEAPPDRTLSYPFFIYDAVWLLFAAAMVVVLRPAALAGTLDAAPAYPVFVLVALVLTVAGPLMAVFLWWLVRSRTEAGERTGLFAVAMLRGALATFAGVAMWTIARLVLDYLRTGRFF